MATPAEQTMARCAHCNGHFGLVRYRHFGRQFCSNASRNRCKQRYLADHAGALPVKLTNAGLMIVEPLRKLGRLVCALNFGDMTRAAKRGMVRQLILTPYIG